MKSLRPALLLYALLSVPTLLFWPPAWSDEAMFGDAVFTLADQGRLAAPYLPGFERAMYWQPPLWFCLEAPIVRLAGDDLAVLRMTSVVLAGVLLLLLFRVALAVTGDAYASGIAACLLALNPLFVHQIKLARMDALCMVFVLLGILLYCEYMRRPSLRSLSGAGIAFALAILTHPFGLLGLAGTGIQQLQSRDQAARIRFSRWLALLFPTLVVVVAMLTLSLSDLATVQRQLHFQFGRKWSYMAGRPIAFFARYWSIPVFALIPVAGIAQLWSASRAHASDPLHVIFILGVISLAVVIVFFIPSYSVYYLPYVCIGTGLLTSRAIASGTKKGRLCVAVGSTLLVVNAAMHFGILYARVAPDGPADTYKAITEHAASYLRPGATVCIGGYPDLYFGLRKARPDLHLLSTLFIDSVAAASAVQRMDHVVICRMFDLARDSTWMRFDISRLEALAEWDGKMLRPVASFGIERDYHASVLIFDVQRTTGTNPQ
jgi:4-amino-4-deoxy-L-arabinose transferase-like glycosyltransferase